MLIMPTFPTEWPARDGVPSKFGILRKPVRMTQRVDNLINIRLTSPFPV